MHAQIHTYRTKTFEAEPSAVRAIYTPETFGCVGMNLM